MARIGPAPPPADAAGQPRRRAAAVLALALALPGCETLDRMDYLDRFFEPAPVFAAASRPDQAPAAPDWPPRPAPVVAMEPRPNPPADWGVPAGAVVATEPRPDAAFGTAPDRDLPAGPVVAMEPRPNPPAATADGNAPPNRAPRATDSARPEQAVAAAGTAPPRPDPESRTRMLVRQNPWLTRFWMELTPAQQSRVERQLQRTDLVLAAGRSEPAAAWDSMGLADRAKLVFGDEQRPAPAAPRDGSTWARSS